VLGIKWIRGEKLHHWSRLRDIFGVLCITESKQDIWGMNVINLWLSEEVSSFLFWILSSEKKEQVMRFVNEKAYLIREKNGVSKGVFRLYKILYTVNKAAITLSKQWMRVCLSSNRYHCFHWRRSSWFDYCCCLKGTCFKAAHAYLRDNPRDDKIENAYSCYYKRAFQYKAFLSRNSLFSVVSYAYYNNIYKALYIWTWSNMLR
jgi:hypothetical protein